MFLNNLNDITEARVIRQKKNTLRYLKEAFESDKLNIQKNHLKHKGELQNIISKMKVQRLKQVFYNKLTLNNVYQSVRRIQLLSEQQINKKRLIKWKGFKLHQHLLSIIYILEIVFLVITFYISTCIAFLPNFIDSGTHNSAVVIGLNAATALFSCMKIGITSTTQTIKKGIMLIYITDIFMAYAKSLILFVDLIYLCIIITLFILRSASSEISNLGVALFIWSIIRISISNENLTYFRTTFLNSFKKEQYYKLFKVILFNFIFAHFVASMLLAMSEIDDNQNWMISMNIYHELWYVQYMWSYYWATTIMMTVGFGDFLPVTYKEGFIVSLIEFFSCIVLAYNISEIGGIISTIRASQDEYIAKLGIFKRMAQQNTVDLELKIRIQDYLREEKAIKQRFEFKQQAQLLQSLPQPLKKEFIMASNGKIFVFLPFFKSLHKNTLMLLTQFFTSKVYYPGEIISKANEHNNFINILKQGIAGMTYRKENSILNGIVVQQIKILNRDSLNQVGEFVQIDCPILLNTEFLTPGKIVDYDINALSYSYVFQLDQAEFITAIKSSEIDSEYFFSIIHSTLLGKSGWEQLPCDECENFLGENFKHQKKTQRDQIILDKSRHLHFHTKFQCPRLHFMPSKGIVIMKYNRTLSFSQQSKPKYKRRKERSQSCLLLRKKAFKAYERKRFINEKKDFQKFVQKSISYKSGINFLKPKKMFSEFRRENIRKNSEGNYQNMKKKIQFNESNFEQQYDQSQVVEFRCNPSENMTMSEPEPEVEDQRTIIESVVKFAVDQVYPRHVSLLFWDLEIDMMWNFLNYFPNYNAVRFDNTELIRNKAYKNKALCMVGEILKHSGFSDSTKFRIQDTIYEQNFSNQQAGFNDRKKSTLETNLDKYNDQIILEDLGTKRVQPNLKHIGSKQALLHSEQVENQKVQTKKFFEVYQNYREVPNSREKILIHNRSKKKFDQFNSETEEQSIVMSFNKQRNEVNQSDSLLNNNIYWD